MNGATRDALRGVNRRFYDRFAADFDHRRQRPWPGWQRVISHLGSTSGPASVLDVGCGNGRFASCLAERWPTSWSYVGLDGCAELLAIAAERLAGLTETPVLRHIDILGQSLGDALENAHFDLITLFGVLHHVPGSDERRRLLRRLGARLNPGGMLALSVWRLDRSPRFDRLEVSWASYGATRSHQGLPPFDTDELDPGDALLSWSGRSDHPRYCHFPNDDEIADWIDISPPLVDRFEADGPSQRDNLYLLFAAP